MITVSEILELCTDDSNRITIYDFGAHKEVFRGTMHEAMISDYADCAVCSFDLDFVASEFCLNIDTSDEM